MTSTSAHTSGPALDHRLELLRRPDGTVQLGWGPDTGALVVPPEGIDAFDLLTVLRMLDGRHARERVLARITERGMDAAVVDAILDELVSYGALRDPARTGSDTTVEPRVRIHGDGPLADAIAAHLGVSSVRVSRSGSYPQTSDVAAWNVQCVLLTDDLTPDPHLVLDLMRHRIPHLPVRLRDGRGVVGPFVVPGRTSCLRCADLARTDLDPAWPHLAAQLWGRVGRADPAVVLATAAVAVGQIDAAATGRPENAPLLVDRTLEVDLGAHRFTTRRWFRHPRCTCTPATGAGRA
ncbi:TOMM precursor leader peptide-binding protein [Rhodococcus zopfii]|uniref:TOMM precursor leader peptide-binding protein n=1 Tax=Rhodococcus zopfii TaxID=43772 RepID=UPI0011114976|nr:TOMM precursor leader peptide-binding protein [Rhodococcus zopfii]